MIYSDLESVGSEFGLTRESVRQILKRLWRLLGQYYPELLRGPEFLAEIQDKMERLAMHLDGSLPVAPKVTLPKVQKLERQKNWRKSIHFRMSPAFEKGITSETLKRDRVSLLIELVALAYELDSADIREAKRLAEIIWARDLSLYLLSRELGMGIVKILPYFAKTNPQQLVHACRRIESSLKNDPVVKKEIEDLRTLFRQVTQSVR